MSLQPIGYVRRETHRIILDIIEEYIPGLTGLNQFSHAQILWWFHHFDHERYRNTLLCHPPYDAPETGVFACRSPCRPNPVALTVVQLLDIDEHNGIIHINNIDAEQDSPIIDIKGYFPVCDRVRSVTVPSWAAQWSKWFPDEGARLEK